MSKQNKCEGCPLAALDREHIAEHGEEVDALITQSVSPDLDTYTEQALRVADHLAGIGSIDLSIFEALTPEELAIALRTKMGEYLAIINTHVAEIEAEKAGREAACMGALTVRAAYRGELVTITVCESPEVKDDDIQPAVVKRVLVT